MVGSWEEVWSGCAGWVRSILRVVEVSLLYAKVRSPCLRPYTCVQGLCAAAPTPVGVFGSLRTSHQYISI
jgi:hypothetical protein